MSGIAIPIPITDHFAAGERICHELLLICPDPNASDFDGREDEMRLNSAIRAVLHQAMDIIEHSQRMRQIQAENDDGSKDPVVESLRAGMNVGEETAARRIISRFALAFNGF